MNVTTVITAVSPVIPWFWYDRCLFFPLNLRGPSDPPHNSLWRVLPRGRDRESSLPERNRGINAWLCHLTPHFILLRKSGCKVDVPSLFCSSAELTCWGGGCWFTHWGEEGDLPLKHQQVYHPFSGLYHFGFPNGEQGNHLGKMTPSPQSWVGVTVVSGFSPSVCSLFSRMPDPDFTVRDVKLLVGKWPAVCAAQRW